MHTPDFIEYIDWKGYERDLVTTKDAYETLELSLELEMVQEPTKQRVSLYLATVESKASMEKALHLLGINF